MPSSRYYRIKTINRIDKVRRWKAVFFWFSFGLAFLIVIWSFFFSPFFKITEIKLPQTNIVTNDDIKQFIIDNGPFNLGQNLIILGNSNLKSRLSTAFPEIKDIAIKKIPFHTLEINFQKRMPLGIWCNDNNCYYFDRSGIIFKDAPISEGSLILKITDLNKKEVSKGDIVLGEIDLNFIISFTESINKSDKMRVIEFKIKPKASIDLEAITDGGWPIYLDSSQDPSVTANDLIATLNEAIKKQVSKLEYIDLRIPSRIFYKLK